MFIGWLVGWMVCLFVAWFDGSWLVGFFGWLVDFLVSWLVGFYIKAGFGERWCPTCVRVRNEG